MLDFIYDYIEDLKSDEYQYNPYKAFMFRNYLRELYEENNQDLKCFIDAADATYNTNDHEEWLFHDIIGSITGAAVGVTTGHLGAYGFLKPIDRSIAFMIISITGFIYAEIGSRLSNYNMGLILFIDDAYACTNSMEL